MGYLATTTVKTLIAASLALALTATATHSTPCPDDTRYVPEDALTSTYPVYVTIDEAGCACYMFSVWIYAESNGEQGLQRHDDFCHHVDADGTPYTDATADTIIF